MTLAKYVEAKRRDDSLLPLLGILRPCYGHGSCMPESLFLQEEGQGEREREREREREKLFSGRVLNGVSDNEGRDGLNAVATAAARACGLSNFVI